MAFLTRLRQVFTQPPIAGTAASATRPAGAPARRHVPVYPPIDQGIEAVTVEEVLSSQSALLARIRVAAGGTEQEFERLYLPALRNYARYVHLLPATRDAHHRGAGGMVRLGFEIALYALQATGGVIFAGRESSEARRILEPRWKYATFLAGLCAELYRPLNDMMVFDSKGAQWPAYQVSLADWLADGRDRYFVRWSEQATRGFVQRASSSFVLARIVPEECIQYLQQGATKIISTMLGAITGSINYAEHLPLQHIVEDMCRRVIAQDTKTQPDLYGRLTVGSHLEPYLIDAMRRLFKSGQWKVNEKKARLWYGQDGLYLVWKTAANEILELLTQDHIPGVPQDTDTISDILVAANVFQRTPQAESLWTIRLPETSTELSAMKFTNEDVLFADAESRPTALQATMRQMSMPRGIGEGDVDTETGEIRPSAPTAVPAPPALEPTPSSSAPAPGPRTAQNGPDAPCARTSAHDEQTKSLLSRLPDAAAEVMGALLLDLSKGKTEGLAWTGKDGFVITVEKLGGYGVDANNLMKDLHNMGWLLAHGPKRKKFSQVTLNDKAVNVVTIPTGIARDLGFIRDPS